MLKYIIYERPPIENFFCETVGQMPCHKWLHPIFTFLFKESMYYHQTRDELGSRLNRPIGNWWATFVETTCHFRLSDKIRDNGQKYYISAHTCHLNSMFGSSFSVTSAYHRFNQWIIWKSSKSYTGLVWPGELVKITTYPFTASAAHENIEYFLSWKFWNRLSPRQD